MDNIYYDTENFDLARISAEKPYYKEKLRLRRYAPDGRVYAELKKKLGGVVYKRREPLGEGESQISREIEWFARRNGLKPMVRVTYRREAFSWRDRPDVRVTFDSAITAEFGSPSFDAPPRGASVTDRVILEIKTPDAFPGELCRIMSEAAIFPAPFSKYAAACAARNVCGEEFALV